MAESEKEALLRALRAARERIKEDGPEAEDGSELEAEED